MNDQNNSSSDSGSQVNELRQRSFLGGDRTCEESMNAGSGWGTGGTNPQQYVSAVTPAPAAPSAATPAQAQPAATNAPQQSNNTAND